MIARPPSFTRTATLFPDTTLFRSTKSGSSYSAKAERGQFLATDAPDVIIFRLTNGTLVNDAPGYRTPRVLTFTSHDLPINLPKFETFRARGGRNLERTLPELVRYSRSEEHTSELQSLMRISYAVFCLKKKTNQHTYITTRNITQN